MKKYSSFLRLLFVTAYSILFNCGIYESSANQNRQKIKKVVFGDNAKRAAKIKGKVTGSKSSTGKLYAFLIRTNSQISKELQALIAPNYQVEVNNNQFSIPFAQSGLYMVGVFEDKIQNGLLDLYDDPYWFAENMPVRLSSSKTYEFVISLDNEIWPKIQLKNFPENYSLLFQISSIEGSPFILIPIESNSFELTGISKPFGFSVIVDRNENEIVDPAEQTRNVYWVPSTSQDNFTVEYNQIWNPLTIEYPNGNHGLELRIETISTDPKLQKSVDLPNPIGSDKSVSLAHLELGEYQLFIKPPQAKEEIKGPYFVQERESRWEIPLSEEYSVNFKFPKKINNENRRLQFFMNGAPIYNCKAKKEIKLYQAGQYEVAWYSDANTKEGLNSDTVWDHIHATANFELTEQSQAATINLSDRGSIVTIEGQYNWMHIPPSEVHLHFFQETDIQGYWNNLFSYKTIEEDSINLPLKLDVDSNRNLYIYLDLDRDGNLAEVKPEYIQTIDPRQLQLQDNEFTLPIISSGKLILDIAGPNPENYFLEIIKVDTKDIITSTFLVGGKNIFENLPIGYTLNLNLIHDVNSNQELDSEDKVLAPKPINIHLFEQNLTLPINLENL